MNGLTDASDIAHLLASRYHDLYSSVPYNVDEMYVILNSRPLDSSLAGMYISKVCNFSISEVEDAVSRLKLHTKRG